MNIDLGGFVNSRHDKFSSVHSENNTKDELVMKHAKAAEEAIAGWEKAEAEAIFLKQKLNEALRQRIAAEDRIVDLDAALKECMQQFRFNREEQEQSINDAVMHLSREHEQKWMLLEEKLQETTKKLAELDFENSHLSKTLLIKEKVIEELVRCKTEAEKKFNKLLARLDTEEKSNLKSADVLQNQHKESMTKIIKLEKECQRLRLMLQKHMVDPATLEEVKSEVLRKEPDEFNPQMVDLMEKNFASHDTPGKKFDILVEKLCWCEEENRTLKDTITKKNNEIHSLRTMGARSASSLWSLSKAQTSIKLARSTSHDLSLTSFSESGHEDEISCSESWTYALITEPEHFTDRKSKGSPLSKTNGILGMDLMDDFIEMEKLAKVSMDKSYESSDPPSHGDNTFMHSLGAGLCAHSSAASAKDLVIENNLGSGEISQDIQLNEISIGKCPGWLQDILRLILWQIRITRKSADEILEEAGIALASMGHSGLRKVIHSRENSGTSRLKDTPDYFVHIACTPPSVPLVESPFHESVPTVSPSQRLRSDVSHSVSKIIELVEEIGQPSLMCYSSPFVTDNGDLLEYNTSDESTGYVIRVFQWKSSELHTVLQQFIHTCNDLVNGKAPLENFPREISSALEWIFNHCFSIQDVSRMRDTVKKQFDLDDSESESELGNVMGYRLDAERVQVLKEQLSSSSASLHDQNDFSQTKEIHLKLKKENMMLKQKLSNMESVQKDLEGKLQLETKKIEELLIQLRELEESVGSAQTKIEVNRMVENKTEIPKFLCDDLDSQLTDARNELNATCQIPLSLELELENRISRCQELETTCIELQLQLDSVAKREVQKNSTDQAEAHLQTGWEITAASEKLAECQETILNLGKQLKALASPEESALVDNVISIGPTPTSSKNTNHRCSLLDKMLSEDNSKFEEFITPKKNETMCTTVDPLSSLAHPSDVPSITRDLDSQVMSRKRFLCKNETEYNGKAAAGKAVAIVPSNWCGGVSLLRKIVLGRKRETAKRSLPMVA